MIYLDNSATAPLLPEVEAKMTSVMAGQVDGTIGNASSLHAAGQRAKQIIEEARTEVADLIGAQPEEIIFVSGGSEANNTIAHIFAGQNIAISSIEHPSMLESAHYYARNLILIPVDQYGFIDLSQISGPADNKTQNIPAGRHNSTPQTRTVSQKSTHHSQNISQNSATELNDLALISVMLANNELGAIEPVAEVAQQYKTTHTFIHSDATQAAGKIKVNVDDLGVDYLTFSAHKLGGPIGVGALYVRQGTPYRPLILGGHQENRRRAGTSNVAAIAGFGEAARLARLNLPKYQKVAKLRDQLRQRILAEVPFASGNSPEHNCLPHLLNVSFRAAEGESIQLYLDAHDIIVSTGSACAAGDLQPSHVLMATRGDAERAHSSIRFSLGLNTTEQEINEVMKYLPEIIQRLQGISTIKITGA